VQGDLAGLAACTQISAWNDRLTVGIIEQTARQFRLPNVGWCWLALGSEGRMEQTFLTDQDNALIFEAADAREATALRELFLPFAHAVNETLAACGFARCPGGIMAGNPACCLSLDEWRERFIDWVRRPDPQALLNASIFFDLRPLAGQRELGEGLRQLMLSMTQDTPSFLHLMAANALAAEPPLTFRGDVQAGAEGVDLKKFGSRIFVDAARIFALAHGVSAVSTTARLSLAGPAAALTPDEIPTVNAAFSHILRLRLQGQLADEAAARPLGHALRPASLHDVDRVILREVLHQARRLQQRLKLNYSL
jgi:CBS domain-containing protein